MSIIYSYPIKGTPANDDLILISDSASSPQFATKQIKVSSLPGGSASGVSSFNTLTGAVTITGGTNVTLNPVGNNIEINASGGGDTYTLQAEAKSSNSVPLKLDAATGTDSTVSLTEGANVTLTRNSATEITIAATGGNAGVSSFTNTNGTYISAGTANSAATGAVTVGTIDLSAQDGSSATNTTRFLSKDNEWAVPSYTTYNVMGSGNSYAAGLVLAGNATHGNQFLRKDGTWQTVSNTNIGGTNLALTSNRTLNFYTDTTDKSLTFIGGDLSGTKTLFKFDTITNKPRFTIGDIASNYEGTLDITGNGSNRTGKINLYNAAGTYSINIQAPTTFGANLNIPYVLPDIQGSSNTYLKNNGSGTLSWDTPTGGGSPDGNNTEIQYNNNGSFGATDLFTYNSRTLSVGKVGDTARSHFKVYGGGNSDAHLTLYCSAGTHGVTIEGPDHTGGSNYTLKLPASLPSSTNQILESNASGALSWINTPGSGGSLGFAPLEIYSASTTSSSSHSIYYMVAVCDVDFTVNKCKLAVTSGSDPIYVAVYSMSGSTLQNSTLSKLGDLNNLASIVGVNELSLTDSAFGLTAGQTICIGISTANILASGPGINNTNLGLMNSGGGSTLPTNPDFEGFVSSNSRPAIHFYAS